MADAELRRVRGILEFVLSGDMPSNASLELRNISQASSVQYRIKGAAAAARGEEEMACRTSDRRIPFTLSSNGDNHCTVSLSSPSRARLGSAHALQA